MWRGEVFEENFMHVCFLPFQARKMNGWTGLKILLFSSHSCSSSHFRLRETALDSEHSIQKYIGYCLCFYWRKLFHLTRKKTRQNLKIWNYLGFVFENFKKKITCQFNDFLFLIIANQLWRLKQIWFSFSDN